MVASQVVSQLVRMQVLLGEQVSFWPQSSFWVQATHVQVSGS